MIYYLNKNIVFVQGACRGAIYNFDNGKVYSLSEQAASALYKTCKNCDLTEFEKVLVNKVLEYLHITDIKPVKYSKPIGEKKLKFVWLELTQLCNFRCLHCYEGNSHCEVQEPLTESEWILVLQQLKDCGCKGIQFIGGEPTVVPYFQDLLKCSHEIGFKNIEIYSNLYLLSDVLIETIIRYNVSVKFSIYGSNSEIHDKITQHVNSFNVLIANIKRLKQAGVMLKANIVIMRENENDLGNIVKLLDDLEIFDRHYDAIRKVPGGTQSSHIPKKEYFVFTKPNFSITKEKFENAFEGNTCWNGKFVISTDGRVLPCEFERNISYGNVRNQKIEDILKSSVLKENWSLSFDFIEHCSCCEYRFACFDCRPLAYSENNNMLSKNPRCKYNPEIGLWNVL